MIENIKTILKKTAIIMLMVCIELPCIVGLLIFCMLVQLIEGEEE